MKSYRAGLLTQVGAAGASLEASQIPATHKALPSLPEFGGFHPQHRDKASTDHTAVCMQSLQSTAARTQPSPLSTGVVGRDWQEGNSSRVGTAKSLLIPQFCRIHH